MKNCHTCRPLIRRYAAAEHGERAPRRARTCLAACVLLVGLLQFAVPTKAAADEVLDWNGVLRNALVVANTPGALQPRLAAIVHGAMFDALNGIERRFTPFHVEGEAPHGASRRAAVVYAAYTTLVGLFPAQAMAFADALEVSLADISPGKAIDHSKSIQRGRVWGERVANEILAWRNSDGFNSPAPPYVGRLEVGKWRPTPPNFAPGLAPTLASTLTFVIPNSSTFRPIGPPPLTSAEYAENVEEVKRVGELQSLVRTADQTEGARFWAGSAVLFWNRAAETAAMGRHTTLSENARLFAVLNAAMADAIITCWDSKYFYELWRPITAIQLADTDGNAATQAQPGWTPLIATPPYPEYFSGHQSSDRSAAVILTAYFGNTVAVDGTSETLPGVHRQWENFTAAADEAFLARIWSGIHFRFAMEASSEMSAAIAEYVLEHGLQPLKGKDTGKEHR